MRLLWKVLRYLIGGLGFVVTYGALIAELTGVKPVGISWAWYALIGVSLLVFALVATLIELYRDNRNFRSQATKLDSTLKQQQLQNEQWIAKSRGDDIVDF